MNRSEPIEKKSGILSDFFNGMKELLRSPKKLIPTFVLCAVWIAFSLMSAFGVNLPFFRFLYTLTYANGGMYGGFFGAVGGLFGKAVFAAFVNTFVLSLCEKKNPFRGFGKGVKTLALNGLTAVSPFVIGGGLGLLFYSFFNVTSAVSNSAVALVAAAAALQAAGRQNGLFFSLLFGVVGKLSKGKTPSHTTVSRLLAGISAGSAIGFPLTFTRYPILLFSVGAGLLAIGIVLAIVGKTGLKKASAAAAALFLTLGVASLPFSASLLHVRADEGGFSMVISDDEAKKIDPNSAFNDLGGVEGVLYFAFYDAGSIAVNESGSGYSFSVPSYRGKGRLGTLDLGSSCSGMTFSGTDFEKTEGFNNDTYTAEFTSSGPVTVSMTSCSWTNADEIYTLTCTLDSFIFDLSFYYPARYDAETGNIRADATLRYSGTVQDSETGDSSVFEENTSYFDFTMCDYKVGEVGDASAEKTDEGDEGSAYVPYHGRLTYTNGQVNKYGQPFPDLMDFDGDGDIDYHDRELRHELVHNPNYLDLPETAGGIVGVSLLTALLGAAGGTAAAASSAAAGAAGSAGGVAGGIGSLPDLGRYIKRDEDGDLNVTDPATGEKRVYVHNGDGSYTNPLTGATYTEDELKDSLSSRAENAGLIRQDTAAAQAAIAEQREDNQTLSQGAIEYSAEKARVEAEQAKEDHLDEMWLKYGGERGDADSIKAAAEAKQEREAANAAYYQNLGDRYDTAVKAAETVQTAADVGVDVLSTVTGNQGIKTAYTVGKNMASRLSDAHVNGGDMKMAAIMAGFDSIADITADKLEGSGFHITANVGSDTFKKTMQNLSEGKDWNDGLGQAVTTGAVKGTVAKLGSLMNDSASANTQEALAKDLEGVVRAKLGGMSDKGVRALRDMRLVTYVNNLHAEQAVNVATTVAVDAGKTVTDKVSEAYSELKEQMKKED